MDPRALLVEDDRAIATVITTALEAAAFHVDRCDSVVTRDALLASHSYDVMLTDVVLLDGDGITTLGGVREAHLALPVIILSAQNTLDTAVRATGASAFEYFPKPFDLEELVRAASQAADACRRSSDGAVDREGVMPLPSGLPLIGRSPAMQDVFRMIARVLDNDLTVLVTGESGTGKELVAEAIHQLGRRKDKPFVAVNTAAIPRELVESELFGHEKGAFTGALARSIGKFEAAHGGTLFLDEIGDMPAEAQTRLLRALQSGRVRRVGGQQEIACDVRIIAATNRRLPELIASGRFREDLFYRLNVVPIPLPPLRGRPGDIAPLARHFLQLARAEGLPGRTLSEDAAAMLEAQAWPGNVRQLRHLMIRAALVARRGEIDAQELAPLLDEERAMAGGCGLAAGDIGGAVARWLEASDFAEGQVYRQAIAVLERPLIEHALARTSGNQLQAARHLGINRNTLRKRCDELGVQPEVFARGR